jgi:hypothetical protein
MKNKVRWFTLLGLILFTASNAQAQTKVFKEVAEGISSQFEVITQDDKLVGYLGFTQLEQASADSFNYVITIMDENLNDIGAVNFRERKLSLKGVTFEQDVLCLAYLKTNFEEVQYHNKKQFKEVLASAKATLFTQFISLDGKIKTTNDIALQITPKSPDLYSNLITGNLKHDIQLRNIPGAGFACFAGDEQKNFVVVFNASGKLLWRKDIDDRADDFSLQTSKNDVNLLMRTKQPDNTEGGYMLASFNALNGSAYPKFRPTDRKSNELKILSLGNDPVSGDLVLSGMIIDPRKCPHRFTARGLHHGIYCGIFSIDIKAHTKAGIQADFAYWNDESNPNFSKRGYSWQAHAYSDIHTSFRDYQGNTWFAGTGIHPHFRTGGMIVGALFSWFFLIPTAAELGVGFYRYKAKDVELLKLDPKGNLTYETSIPTASGVYQAFKGVGFSDYETSAYYDLTNPETKTDYLVVSDPKNVAIYNIQQKKIARTIPTKEHKNTFKVFPAKEGYYMVSEYNKKEKTTRLSIEAL